MPQSHFRRAPGGEWVSHTNPGCLKLHLVTVTLDTGAARQQIRFPPIKSNGQRTGTVGWPYGHRPGTVRRPWGTRPMFFARAEPARWTGGGRTYSARCPLGFNVGYKYCNGRTQKQKHTGCRGVAVRLSDGSLTGPLLFICDELGRKKVCRPSENYNSALKVGGGLCGVF